MVCGLNPCGKVVAGYIDLLVRRWRCQALREEEDVGVDLLESAVGWCGGGWWWCRWVSGGAEENREKCESTDSIDSDEPSEWVRCGEVGVL